MTYQMQVVGQPVSQGSKRFLGNGRMVESNDARLRAWRLELKTMAALARNGDQPLDGPVAVRLDFSFRRPAGHYRTGRFRGQLRDDAPSYSSVRPDVDKLTRAVLDSLTDAGWFRDDSQVATLEVRKTYADDHGVRVWAWALTGEG